MARKPNWRRMPTSAIRVPLSMADSLVEIATILDGAEKGEMDEVCDKIGRVIKADWLKIMTHERLEMLPKPGYIYALGCTEGFWKIGRSKNPVTRMSESGSASPYPITTSHLIPVSDPLWAERYLHSILAEYRTNGEWFNLPKVWSDWLCSIKRCEKDAPPIRTERNRTKRIVQNDKEKETARDERLDHPAIKAVRGIISTYPKKEVWDEIITVVGSSPDLSRMRDCYVAWCRVSDNKFNLKVWLFDWYVNGITERGNNGTETASERNIRRLRESADLFGVETGDTSQDNSEGEGRLRITGS